MTNLKAEKWKWRPKKNNLIHSTYSLQPTHHISCNVDSVYVENCGLSHFNRTRCPSPCILIIMKRTGGKWRQIQCAGSFVCDMTWALVMSHPSDDTAISKHAFMSVWNRFGIHSLGMFDIRCMCLSYVPFEIHIESHLNVDSDSNTHTYSICSWSQMLTRSNYYLNIETNGKFNSNVTESFALASFG